MTELDVIFLRQSRNLSYWMQRLSADEWAAPSVLSSWSIHELVTHLVIVHESFLATLNAPSNRAPTPLGIYVSAYSGYAEQLESTAQRRSSILSSEDLKDHLEELQESLRQVFSVTTPAVVDSARGPITRSDFLATRSIELVVHSDDLARSLPHQDGPEIDGDALKVAVSCLLEARVQQHPGDQQKIMVPGFGDILCAGAPGIFSLQPMEALRLFSGRIPAASLSSYPADPGWEAVLS